MSFFSRLLKVISHKKYQKNPLGKKLSPLQQSVLNIGAVNAEQTMFYCDSLETGSEKEEIKNNLASDVYKRQLTMILLMKKALYIRWNGCWNEDTAYTLMRLSCFLPAYRRLLPMKS